MHKAKLASFALCLAYFSCLLSRAYLVPFIALWRDSLLALDPAVSGLGLGHWMLRLTLEACESATCQFLTKNFLAIFCLIHAIGKPTYAYAGRQTRDGARVFAIVGVFRNANAVTISWKG